MSATLVFFPSEVIRCNRIRRGPGTGDGSCIRHGSVQKDCPNSGADSCAKLVVRQTSVATGRRRSRGQGSKCTRRVAGFSGNPMTHWGLSTERACATAPYLGRAPHGILRTWKKWQEEQALRAKNARRALSGGGLNRLFSSFFRGASRPKSPRLGTQQPTSATHQLSDGGTLIICIPS